MREKPREKQICQKNLLKEFKAKQGLPDEFHFTYNRFY
jgi:hypothetical protein